MKEHIEHITFMMPLAIGIFLNDKNRFEVAYLDAEAIDAQPGRRPDERSYVNVANFVISLLYFGSAPQN